MSIESLKSLLYTDMSKSSISYHKTATSSLSSFQHVVQISVVAKMAALSHTHLIFQYALQCLVNVTSCLAEVSATLQLTVILNIQVAFVKSASHFITGVIPSNLDQGLFYWLEDGCSGAVLKYVSKISGLNFEIISVTRPCVRFFSLR